jgi:hypothetical protein
MSAVALWSVAAGLFVAWFFSELHTSDDRFYWEYSLPLFVEAGIYLIAAYGLARRWRAAFVVAVALICYRLVLWSSSVLSGSPYALDLLALLPIAASVVGLVALVLARAEFWPRRASDQAA